MTRAYDWSNFFTIVKIVASATVSPVSSTTPASGRQVHQPLHPGPGRGRLSAESCLVELFHHGENGGKRNGFSSFVNDVDQPFDYSPRHIRALR
ncbi:MAG: hypothetical protein GFGODING_01564 [Flavobacteriales bacterium]|nr:hypothetical protein [Flavobacteriales bacterium]